MWSKQELIDKQALFWVLMVGGSTLTAACEAVGVNRKSGCRWRQATGGRIPCMRPVSSARCLSLEERFTDRRPLPGRGRPSGDRRRDRPLARNGQS
jgi:hypothetical protein